MIKDELEVDHENKQTFQIRGGSTKTSEWPIFEDALSSPFKCTFLNAFDAFLTAQILLDKLARDKYL